jgi:hypothetical protein
MFSLNTFCVHQPYLFQAGQHSGLYSGSTCLNLNQLSHVIFPCFHHLLQDNACWCLATHHNYPPSKSLATYQFWWSLYVIQCAMIPTALTAEVTWQWTAWCSPSILVFQVAIFLQVCPPNSVTVICDPSLLALCLWYNAELCFRYLTGNQLRGESSVEGYIDALKRGCRCVECAYAYFVSIRDNSIGPSCPAMYSTKQN